MRFNTRQSFHSPTSFTPYVLALHFNPFDIVMPGDSEQIDPEQALGTTESLLMSGYLS